MTPDTIRPEVTYAIDGEDLIRLRIVQKRLYSEKSLNADEMRDLAHIVSFIFDHVYEAEEIL